jgi:mannose-6-phosphate isomerase-like protein (cupin superfamily)
MKIIRWQAPIVPSKEQAQLIFENEDLDPFVESLQIDEKTKEHRHPFAEVRIVIEGELFFNIAGHQILLRAGDRIEIPANTKHTHYAKGNSPALSLCAFRAY